MQQTDLNKGTAQGTDIGYRAAGPVETEDAAKRTGDGDGVSARTENTVKNADGAGFSARAENAVKRTGGRTGASAGAENTAKNAAEPGKQPGNPAAKLKFLIINGPNLNLLGIREPAIYGKDTYETLCRTCLDACRDAGVECELFQSNHEGAIVDKIQEAYGKADGIVINPAAYTHTSVAILDALKAVDIPVAEVHISDVNEREEFRRHSYIAPIAAIRVIGEGIPGYARAIRELKGRIERGS